MTTRLDNTVALVTGAGRDIGQGIAYALAADGTAVAVAGRTESELKETVAEIERRESRAIPVVCDVTEADQISEAVDQTVSALGGLNVLVNNAQEFSFGTIVYISLDPVDVGWRSGPLATLIFMRTRTSEVGEWWSTSPREQLSKPASPVSAPTAPPRAPSKA